MRPIYLILVFVLSLFSTQLVAQSRPLTTLNVTDETIEQIELAAPTGSFWAIHLVNLEGDWPVGVSYRLVKMNQVTENREWHSLAEFPHHPGAGVSDLLFTEPQTTAIELRLPPGIYELYAYDPGPSVEEVVTEPLPASQACPCAQPETVNRENWCPAGNCPEGSSPAQTTVTHLIVHHSAGSNTAADWAAVVRAIWNIHVNTNGWDDIGYNYLVDPNGVIYVGRGDNIRGAHFCGNNTATMGICVLGNFTSVTPAQDALDALAEMLAWKACKEDLDPLTTSLHAPSGLVINHVSGHRQGCGTLCPGDSFFPLFGNLRQSVADVIASCIVSSTSAGLSPSAIVQLAPNPSWGQVQIAANEAIQAVELYDLLGRNLWSRVYVNPVQALDLDMAAFGPGQLLLKLELESGVVVKQLTLR
ncbi:MAG: N-acetylmuramoyl-L-alanine amidase [Bacteroidota bacterium]